MSSYCSYVDNRQTLLDLLRRVSGQKFIGVVDGVNCVELVFDDLDNTGENLVTIMTDGPQAGQVWLGSVSSVLIDAGYGSNG